MLPAPTVRAQEPEESPPPTRPAPLVLPSPEQLGIAAAPPAVRSEGDLDWTAVHQRLDRLGVRCFQLDKTANGCRVTCLLPSSRPGYQRRIEVQATTPVEAVRLLLARIEDSTTARP